MMIHGQSQDSSHSQSSSAPRGRARRAACLAVGALLAVPGAGLHAVPARAGTPIEALRMAWDDCQTSPGSISNFNFTCDTNIGSSSLYCAFSVLTPVDQIVGLEIVVDLQHSEPTLPDYWLLGPAPDCRHDMLQASVDFSGTTECKDPGLTGALLQDYVEGEPGGLPSQARIKAVTYLPSPQTTSISNDTTYHAVRLVFLHDRTVNVNACAGCTSPACLVLNSVLIRRLPDAFGGDVFVSTPGPGNANWAYWRGSGIADCAAVPVRNMTWGTVKSLYR